MATARSTPKSPLAARLARLRALAKQKHRVEVEHLIAFAKLGDPAAAPMLRELATEHAWPRTGRGIVRLGTWVDVVAAFLESGAAGVARQVKSKKLDASFAIGLLEEVPSTAAAVALLEIASRADTAVLGEALGALATVLGEDAVVLDDKHVKASRALAHRTLQGTPTTIAIVHSYGVLAAVGDQASLEMIRARPPLKGAWKGSEKIVITRLKKRLAR